MRQSFEEFLREKTSDYAGDFSRSEVIDLFNEWSSQQPEDEIKHGMAFIEKSIEQEVTELVHTTFGGAEYYNSFIPKLMEILAKHKERR